MYGVDVDRNQCMNRLFEIGKLKTEITKTVSYVSTSTLYKHAVVSIILKQLCAILQYQGLPQINLKINCFHR